MPVVPFVFKPRYPRPRLNGVLPAIENFNEQFKGIFDAHGPVPTCGLRATGRFALGAVFVYQLALLYRHQIGADLRVGLKAFLKAA